MPVINVNSYVFFENWQYSYRVTEKPQYNEITLHRHEAYEMLYFISGDAEGVFENQRKKLFPGDVVLIPPRELHGIEILSDRRYARAVINFAKLPVESGVLALFSQPCIINIAANVRIGGGFQRLRDYADQFSGNIRQQVMTGTIVELLYLLYATERQNIVRPKEQLTPFMNRCLQYMENHITEIGDLREICDYFHISRAYLFRAFKEAMETTPKKYIENRRLHIAKNLISVGESPTKVYLRCGYRDYSAFFRAYKRLFGCAPSGKKPEKENMK